MTSPYIIAALERARLPISVWYDAAFMLGRSYEVVPATWSVLNLDDGEVYHETSPQAAIRAYLALVESLSAAAPVRAHSPADVTGSVPVAAPSGLIPPDGASIPASCA